MSKTSNEVDIKKQGDHQSKKNAATSDQNSEIDRVRELIFGSQSRSLDDKIIKLEQLFNNTMTQLRTETSTQFLQLTQKIEQLGDRLEDMLAAEGRERLADVKNLQTALSDALEQIENNQQENTHMQAELDKRFSAQLALLEQEVIARHESTLQKLQATKENLASSKADRNLLADLLQTMSQEIKQTSTDLESA